MAAKSNSKKRAHTHWFSELCVGHGNLVKGREPSRAATAAVALAAAVAAAVTAVSAFAAKKRARSSAAASGLAQHAKKTWWRTRVRLGEVR